MRKIRRKTKRMNYAMKVRLMGIVAFIAILFVVLIFRLSYFGIGKNGLYKRKVLSQQSYQSETLPYKRGEILDRNDNVLAMSQKLYDLVLEPKNILEKNTTKTRTVAALVKYLGLDEQKLNSFLKRNKESYYKIYKEDLAFSKIEKLKEYLKTPDGKKTAGIVFSKKYTRKYPNKSLASHVVGFVSDGTIGTGGIEQSYNSILSGVNGREYKYLNEELQQDSSVEEPENGQTVVSTLDVNIQKIAEERLQQFEKKYGSRYGSSILVMDPNNGEVLAMANSTAYNLEDPRSDSALLGKYTQSQISAMTDKQKTKAFSEVWKNPIVSKTFEPGSTYKPFTVAGGLEDHILTGNEYYYCDGSQHVGGHTIHCSHRSGHGDISLSQAISLSCNDALMQIAAKEGKNVFTKFQKDFNYGNKTGIDLPGEESASGLLHPASQMAKVDLATSSFGQSFNCSMIQLCSAFCSLVNGGNYYKPHVIKQIRNDKGETVKNIGATLVKETISKSTSDKMKEYMQQTVESGTGKAAKLKDYTVGGKTGTAQKIPRTAGTYIVSFCGFAPVKKPQVVVYVVIDEIKNSSQQNTRLAVEMARDVLKKSLTELND